MTPSITFNFFLCISTSFFTDPTPLIFSPVFEGKMSFQTFQGQPPAGLGTTLHPIFRTPLLSLISFASWLLPLPCPLFPSQTLVDFSLLWNKFHPYKRMQSIPFFFKTVFLKSIRSVFVFIHLLIHSKSLYWLLIMDCIVKWKYGHHRKTSWYLLEREEGLQQREKTIDY